MPPITKETWARLYRVFDHKARLEEDQQGLYVQRPGSVAQQIVDELALEPEGKWVFCGSVGSGKSSELVHLGHRLKDDYVVVGVDLFQSVTRITDVQLAEVLVLIGAAAVRVAEEGWGTRVDRKLVEALSNSFRALATGRGVEVEWSKLLGSVALLAFSVSTGNVPAAAGAGASAIGTVKLVSRPAQRAVLGGLARRNVQDSDPDLNALIDALNAILGAVSADLRRPLLLLVDGLDRVDDPERIRDLFTRTHALVRLSGPVVYAGPIPLMLDTEFAVTGEIFSRKRLTNLVVSAPRLADVQVPEQLVASGRASLREVAARRLASEKLTPEEVFQEEALRRLILCSGGLLRMFVRLIGVSIRHAHARDAERIQMEEVELALHEVASEYDITMTAARRAELIVVQNTGLLSGSETAIGLMIGNYMLPYRNGRVWWAPAPILGPMLPAAA